MITYNGSDLILAPIAGYSDSGMRTLCTRFGAGLCYTEMVSAKGLYYKNENTADLLHIGEGEKHTGVQLFGSEVDIISEVMNYEVLKNFPVIDFNMGCPVPKVVKNGEGSALLKNPTLIYNIVKALKSEAAGRKITVKIRSGFYDGYENAVETALAIQEGGADMVTVHGRTREMFYTGKVNYDIIAKVKSEIKIPVCGNGDVVDKESYQRMKDTGVDYVMIGRGAIGRPYIFSELHNVTYQFSVKEAIKQHIKSLSFLPENVVANNMKKHIAYYLKGKSNSKAIKESIFRANSLTEIVTFIDLIVE